MSSKSPSPKGKSSDLFTKRWRLQPRVQREGLELKELEELVSQQDGQIADMLKGLDQASDQETRSRLKMELEQALDAVDTPVTQGKQVVSHNPSLWSQLYVRNMPDAPNEDYHLISENRLLQVIIDAPQEQREVLCHQLTRDVAVLEAELMDLLRQCDHEAKVYQNRYRTYQLRFILFAALATVFGGLQALAASSSTSLIGVFAFIETVIALYVTYLATLAGREPLLELWLTNRRKAEQMRREYFRFLMHLPPYEGLKPPFDRVQLAKRAAEINRGRYPAEPTAVDLNHTNDQSPATEGQSA